MSKRIALLALCAFACSFPAHATVTLLDKDEWKIGFYGFVEADAIVDSTRSLMESIGNGPVDRPTTYAGDNGRTQLSMRNSRFGFTIDAPKTGDWSPRGVMEFDFLGPGAASSSTPEATLYNNPVLRTRHFYLQAEANGWQLLAGQAWTLFGWQPGYFLATLAVAPVSGMIYQRTMQFTAIKTFEATETQKVFVGASIVRPAQRDSSTPGLDAGVRWAWSGRKAGFVGMTSGTPKAQPLSLGISGRLNQFEYNGTGDTVSTTHMLGSAIAIDTLIPIIGSGGSGGAGDESVGNTLTLTGEFTTGQGYSEAFPGLTGNLPAYSSATPANASTVLNADAGQIGIDPNNGVTLVHLTTFNLQLQYHLPAEWMTFVTAGYGQVYSNNIDPLTSTSKTTVIYDRDETYFVNIGHNFGNQLRIAAEYDVVRTTYSDGVVGHDNRIEASAFFYF